MRQDKSISAPFDVPTPYLVDVSLERSQKFAGEMLGYFEKLVYVLMGVLLIVMAGLTLVGAVRDLMAINLHANITTQLTTVLNDGLFAIILMELLGTVATHLSKGGFQLKSFLIIGIISSVRRILVIGAQFSASQNEPSRAFTRGIEELAVDTGVALVLAFALLTLKSRSPVSGRSRGLLGLRSGPRDDTQADKESSQG